MQKIHYHSAAAYLCYRWKKQPYIFDYDDYDISFPCIFNHPSMNKFFLTTHNYEKMTKLVAKNAVACVVSSHFLLEFLQRYNSKVVLIHTGVDAEKFTPAKEKLSNNKIIFIWTGLVWGEPIFENVRFIFECFKEVAQRHSNLELQLVAGGRWMPQVEELLKTEFARLPIQIRTWVEPQKMPEFLQQADIGLMPLVQETLWTQSKSPTKLFEYLATGLPVVASPTGEVNHVIKDGETGFLGKNKTEFVQKMELLVTDEQLRKTIGSNARKIVEQEFSLDVLSKKLYDFLLQLPL